MNHKAEIREIIYTGCIHEILWRCHQSQQHFPHVFKSVRENKWRPFFLYQYGPETRWDKWTVRSHLETPAGNVEVENEKNFRV